MARATRSTTNLEKSDVPALPRPSSKKRKRLSNADNDDQPVSKLPRTHLQPDSPPAAHAHLHEADATSILDILEVTDYQGLLDRVFPLPSDAPAQGSFSLRALLKQPTRHPLWVLRAAIQNLFPLYSSHPRSQPSDTAIQQHRFCIAALSLLDQASHNSIHVPLSATTLLDPDPTAAPDSPSVDGESSDSAKAPPSPSAYKRYALVQHLPSGDYWTSLNADIHSSTKQLKDLSLGNAELVAVFPTPSKLSSASSVPALASYHAQKVVASTSQLAEQRRVSSGSFLDYGPWASFAPSFDHDGHVGRSELGELLHHRQVKKKALAARVQERSKEMSSIVELGDETRDDVANNGEPQPINVAAELAGLLPSDVVDSIQEALKCLDLENAVSELLERNYKALRRLEELQRIRLSKADGGSSRVEEASEEWEIAHAIMDSLSILASLRPKSTEEKLESIIPPASVFHMLQRTLTRQPAEGWYGTLPPTKSTALRDDATVKVRAGSIGPATAATTTSAATVTPAPTTPYAGYGYAYGQQAYRPTAAAASYTPYKQGQYYQTPYLATASQQLGAQSYYGQQAYAGGTSGQQPYAAYSAWYSQYSAPPANTNATASAASSGRGTPQPAASTAATVPATYGNFFAAAATPPPTVARSPAVANTVLANKPGTPGTTWAPYATGQAPSALPAFTTQLRNAQTQQYYGTYASQQTPTTSAAR